MSSEPRESLPSLSTVKEFKRAALIGSSTYMVIKWPIYVRQRAEESMVEIMSSGNDGIKRDANLGLFGLQMRNSWFTIKMSGLRE